MPDLLQILYYASLVLALLGILSVLSRKHTFWICIAMAVAYVGFAIFLGSWPAIIMAGYFVFCAFLHASRSD